MIKEIKLRVDQRKSLLSLTDPKKATIARDRYHRLWLKNEHGFWLCYGGLVQARGTEVKN